MNQAFRIAARYAAAMDPAKMEALLLKIRKGATASLTWKQLGEVLAVLDPGWKLEKTVGLIKLYGRDDEKGREEAPELYWTDDEADAQRRHKSLEPDAVTSLPTSPKPGKLYVLDLGMIRQDPKNHKEYRFDFRPWMGNDAWKVTSPKGETRLIIPGRFSGVGDFYHGYKPIKLNNLRIDEAVRWLNKETDWLDQINRKLGLDAHEKILRTREGTGSCPVCFQNIKITDGEKIVLHGYKRPGTGTTHGKCEGVSYPAFELNVVGTKDYLNQVVIPKRDLIKDYLKRLKNGEIETISPYFGSDEKIRKGDPTWDYTLKRHVEKVERDLDEAEAYVKAYTKLVQNWKTRPLPKEGDPHIDWFFKGQTD